MMAERCDFLGQQGAIGSNPAAGVNLNPQIQMCVRANFFFV